MPFERAWVDFLGVRFEVGGGGGKLPPLSKTCYNFAIETSNLALKHMSRRSLRKYTF